MNELKPCPFCGGVDIGEKDSGAGPARICFVKCKGCSATIMRNGGELKKARAAWNQRNSPDDITLNAKTVVGNGITEPLYINVIDCSVFWCRVKPDDFCNYGKPR